MQYKKRSLSPDQLLDRLATEKGLVIPDRDVALSALESIGYYRLLIYMRSVQNKDTGNFYPGVTFDYVLDRYNLDRSLRLLTLEAIEKIEVALRAAIVNRLTRKFGPHFHLKPSHFCGIKDFWEFSKKIPDLKNVGTAHYYQNYTMPPSPPIWTLLEALTFGELSILFARLSPKNRKLVSNSFRPYDEALLTNWFRALNYLRNRCAHHNWTWNFPFDIYEPSRGPAALNTVFVPEGQKKYYGRAVVLVALLRTIDSADEWKNKLSDLLTREYPFIRPANLGFPENWIDMDFWR